MENSNTESEIEDLFRESSEHFHDMFENLAEGVAFCQMIFDDSENAVDWVYLYVNRAFGSLTGLENIVGMHVVEAIPGIQESSPELLEIFGRVASTGQPESFETDFTPLSRWLKVSASSPVKNDFIAIFENITESKRVDKDLRKFQETRDIGRDNARDTGRNETRDIGRDETRDIGRDETRDIGRDETRDIGRDETRDIGRDETRDTGRDETRDTGRDETRDTG